MISILLGLHLIMSHAAVTNSASEFTAEYVGHTLDHGLSYSAVIDVLGVTYTSPADRAYLNDLRANAARSNEAFKPRAHRAIAGGFEVTAANGRSFTLTTKAGDVRVNGRKILLNPGSLAHDLDVATAALHASFVVRLMNALDPWPRAEALPQKVVNIMAAGAVAISTYLFTRFASKSDYRALLYSMQNVGETCRVESTKREFDGSQAKTAQLILKSKGVRFDAEEQTEDCGKFTNRVLTTGQPPGATPPRMTTEERDELCVVMKRAAECIMKFSAAKPPAPASPTSGPPESAR